jgi:hypothetical protein
MSWRYGTVIEVRKVRWDMLWHIVYRWGKRITYDRVTKAKALRVAKSKRTVWDEGPSLEMGRKG